MMELAISEKKPSKSLKSLGADSMVFMTMIVVLNLHLLGLGCLDSLILIPRAVAGGEWWRLLTHPFAHVSWYHLILDASAFCMLYSQLQAHVPQKLFYVGSCGAFSLGAALLFSPDIGVLGLCGLSGIAHGLMTVVSMDMIRSGRDRVMGWGCLLGVLIKSVVENLSGGVLFSFVHAGMCGTPLVACHLGGAVGGLVAYGLYVIRHRAVDHG